jgi:hypothetical protein
MIVAVDPEALAAWVSGSRQVQGVPVFVSDTSVLERVRALVAAGQPSAERRRPPVTAPTSEQPGSGRTVRLA